MTSVVRNQLSLSTSVIISQKEIEKNSAGLINKREFYNIYWFCFCFIFCVQFLKIVYFSLPYSHNSPNCLPKHISRNVQLIETTFESQVNGLSDNIWWSVCNITSQKILRAMELITRNLHLSKMITSDNIPVPILTNKFVKIEIYQYYKYTYILMIHVMKKLHIFSHLMKLYI